MEALAMKQRRFVLGVSLLVLMISAVPIVRADMAGWLIARGQDLGIGQPKVVAWSDVQRSGGIKLGQPVTRNGDLILPVEFSGGPMSSLYGAGRAEVRQVGKDLVLTFAQRPGSQIKPDDRGPIRHATLPRLKAGSYLIFYEIAGDAAKKIGTIDLRNPTPARSSSLR
jgi:hypothetical protein